jgi:hypothetical protein
VSVTLNYRVEGPARYTTMMLATGEFIRRFLIHVLPPGFHRISPLRAPRRPRQAERIATTRKLLGTPVPNIAAKANSTGDGDPPCPCCGGRMHLIERFKRGQTPQHRPRPIAIRIDTS